MLRYLDFPPTPAADATRVGASDREQCITSISIVPTFEPSDRDDFPPHDFPSSSSPPPSCSKLRHRPFYWCIWLGLPQRNRFVVLDIVRRGMCSGQLVATTSEHPPSHPQHVRRPGSTQPALPQPFRAKTLLTTTRIKDIFKLVYDSAMDCYAFEGTAGRGRRFWISSVLGHFEACSIVAPGSSLDLFHYFAQSARMEVVGVGDYDDDDDDEDDDDDNDDDMGGCDAYGDMGGDKLWSYRRTVAAKRRALRRSAWPIVDGHFLAPREPRPSANVHRPRLPCEIHGTGFRALQYPFYESYDTSKHAKPHSYRSACTTITTATAITDRTHNNGTTHNGSRAESNIGIRRRSEQQQQQPKLLHRPIRYDQEWGISPPPSPLPLALTSFY